MSTYCDSGVLVKLYVLEENSESAAAAVRGAATVVLNSLQELEIRNAMRALEGRSAISGAQRATSEHMFDRDILLGRYSVRSPDWPSVYQLALRLSREFTTRTLARALDILHVAIAILQSVDSFVTADLRQARMAEHAGLHTVVLESRTESIPGQHPG